MEAGLNLFSIRSLLQSEEEFLATALKLKELGYSYMQFSGMPYDADKIARVSKESGMPICLTHVPMDRIIGETQQLMEEHDKFGCKNIGLGMMPFHMLIDEPVFKQKVEELNKAGELMQKNGFKFFYHHHHFEFLKDKNNETCIDYMLKNAPYINFTADTYWLQYGGVNVLTFLDKLKGRIECVHLKDYRQNLKKDDEGNPYWAEPKFAPVGDGTIDFAPVVKKMKELGVKYYLVEQDDAVEYPDPLEQVARSIQYIKKEL